MAIQSLAPLPSGSFRFTGQVDWAARYIEELQLLDKLLWKLFVDQYRDAPDDEDLGWRCEYWGKMMRGACITYQYTQNAALYAVLTETIRDMLTAQDNAGRFSTYSVEKEFHGWDMWGRKYILLGFLYFLEICNDPTLRETIIRALKRHADYILERIGPASEGKTPITETSHFWEGMNSSSILEPFVKLYRVTGERRYFDFATYIVETGCIRSANVFDLAYEGKLKPYEYPVTKAYETMSCFEGLIEYYGVIQEPRYLRAIQNFAEGILETDVTVIGCCGCTHELFDHSRKEQTNLERSLATHMQETCVTVTWMKLCWRMLCLTGDPKYADALEISAFNALYGTINTAHSRKSVPRALALQPQPKPVDANTVLLPFDSYSPLLPSIRGRMIGGFKSMDGGAFYGCCACIGSAGTGLVPLTSVMRRADGFAVNLYARGSVSAQTPTGQPLTLQMETDYPYDGAVRLHLHLEKPERFALALRIPGWCKTARLGVNGQTQPVGAGYAVLEEIWHDGDAIALSIDMPVIVHRQDGYTAFQRGPVMLASDARLTAFYAGKVPEKPAANLYADITIDGEPCLHLMDYASAGATWDEDSEMAVWLKAPDGEIACICFRV